MTLFIATAVNGLSLGVIYGLIALGFSSIFRATGVLNFAHGSFLLAGAYVASSAVPRMGFVVGVMVGTAAAAAIAWTCDVVVFRRIKGDDHVRVAMITLGINTVVLTEVGHRIGTRTIPLGDPWGLDTFGVFGASVPSTRIAAIVLAAVVLVGLFAAFSTGDRGIAVRAANQDREAAMLVGVSPARLSALAWIVGGGLAAIAGIFLSLFPSPGVHQSLSGSALKAFPAAVLGGLGSLGGAVVGGIAVGLIEAFVLGYGGRAGFIDAGFGSVVPYFVLIAVLLIRPTGVFGRREVERV